jgi:alkaline phosphatase D
VIPIKTRVLTWISVLLSANGLAGADNWETPLAAGRIDLPQVAPILIQNTAAPAAEAAKAAGRPAPARKPKKIDLRRYARFQQPPEPMLKLYDAVHNALAANPDATYMDVSNHPVVQQVCRQNGIVALGGPMLGSVRSDGVAVWVRTARPAQVEVRVKTGRDEKVFGPVASTPASDLSAVVQVAGLAPQTTYSYRVLVDGREIPMPDGAAITTAPRTDAPGSVRVAFGSCFHEHGLGNDKQARAILATKPHAMLIYGDAAVGDRSANFAMHRSDFQMRDILPAWRMLGASVPVYNTWDDHDYFSNDLWGTRNGHTDADRRGVREVFTKAWANPAYGFGDDQGGVFLHTRIGPIDVIMLDNRYFRTGDKSPGDLLGRAQLDWLKRELLGCEGRFIVITCGTMWSDYISGGKDSWGQWDRQGREELFSFIESNRIAGVLLCSGDRHGARGFSIPRPSGFEFYEFEPASLGRMGGPETWAKDRSHQLFGFSDLYAFGEFTFDTTPADPTVQFRLIDEDGKVLFATTLTRSRLTPGG